MDGIEWRHAAVPLPVGERAWAYALGAPYHAAHGLCVDGVVHGDPLGEFQQPMLARDWGIRGREELIVQMNHLGSEGHRLRHGRTLRHFAMLWRPAVAALREEFRSAVREGGETAEDAAAQLWRLDAVQADRDAIRSTSLLAFDTARGVMLARAGLMLGWLEEDEAWAYMTAAAREARRTYASWDAYGAGFVLARNVWAGTATQDLFDEVVAALRTAADSPWHRLPWDLPGLADLPAPRPAAPGELVWTLER